MGYRTEFENLLNELFETIKSFSGVDHDAKAFKGNKPDFVIRKNNIPILYIEVKDIGVSLDKIEKSDQMNRYFGYANLVLSDYLEFRFYRNGFRYQEPIKLAEYDKNSRSITPKPENFDLLKQTLLDFAQSHKEPIRSGEHLAKIMGGKAQRIRDNVKQFLSTDSEKNNEIIRVYKTIKKLLVHDLDQEDFADMYAQTLVYGLFVARYHDETSEDFTRKEAAHLIPKSNPLLRDFFDHIAGIHFDKRLEYIVNELCEVFTHANVQKLMEQYFQDDLWGKTHEGPDPVIHFYEDFLKEYDSDLRKKLGAYYTPLPVVRFIVRSVDYLLEKEFSLPNGLADTSKSKNDIHRVQILDPAVGTGTFISATIRLIYKRLINSGQKGRWHTYVHNDLLPRLHGFELMMAPYTIAHLKLSMAFRETGFKYFNRRLGIYLTNSLEESSTLGDLFTGFGFAESIAEESKEAALIKNNTPIMVVLGNPPYSVSSSNKSRWITDLIKDYKKNLNEKNIQPLSDDYIKFIRFAEYFIEKNKTGIVAMITNNSFIDGLIHRQMRKHLLETFDDIYVLDLHGNAKKKESSPDGSKDENVFDIQQGVAIFIMIRKTINKRHNGNVKFFDIYGKRNEKYLTLNDQNLNTIPWQQLSLSEPNYFFTHKDFQSVGNYSLGFRISDLFINSGTGIKTNRDNLLVDFTSKELVDKIEIIKYKNNFAEINDLLKIKDGKYWNTEREKNKIISNKEQRFREHSYLYRPFDNRWVYYQPNLIEIGRGGASKKIMMNMLRENLCIISTRQLSTFDFQHIFITKYLSDMCSISLQTKETSYAFPLYLYSEAGAKTPNLNNDIFLEIENLVGKTSPEEIVDYIYAVLHSPTYREKYKEFLKIDFPRVPYPKNNKTFNELVSLGTELRLIHLLESPKVNNFITTFPIMEGNEVVEKIKYNNGKVWINKLQYFGNVPEVAWHFYIGGFQPAQKWLKDRIGRNLTNQDIEHYQKIIVTLMETDRLMKEIDKINFF
ncbi:MAG: DNA methyltransferase [Ignavibacteriae bacterium]|nr:DNA methyltransferase [Ignavibacteriota bacterium]